MSNFQKNSNNFNNKQGNNPNGTNWNNGTMNNNHARRQDSNRNNMNPYQGRAGYNDKGIPTGNAKITMSFQQPNLQGGQFYPYSGINITGFDNANDGMLLGQVPQVSNNNNRPAASSSGPPGISKNPKSMPPGINGQPAYYQEIDFWQTQQAQQHPQFQQLLGQQIYNQMPMYGNASDMGLGMWGLNELQGRTTGTVPFQEDAQDFPQLGGFPGLFQPNQDKTASKVNEACEILDSSELEKKLLENLNKTNGKSTEQKQQNVSNSSETSKQSGQVNKTFGSNQVQEITDMQTLFSQLNVNGNQNLSANNNTESKENTILVRTKQGVYLMDYTLQGTVDEANKISPWNAYSFFIQDGHYIVCADAKNIGVFSTRSKQQLDHVVRHDIQELILSPLQKYLVCIEKPDESDTIICQILDALSLQIHKQMEYSFYSKSRPNLILFDKNESKIFIREKRELKIYDTTTFELITTLNTENFTHQYLSPSAEQQRLLFLTPEYSKGYEMIPAQLKLFNLSDLSHPILNQSISKSQEVIPVWSPDGKHLLLWCSTIKDDTGNTYYGQHIVYRFKEDSQSLEQLNFYKGVIHDIKWQPSSDHFVVIGGGMPSHSVIFTKDGVPLFEFGRHHINKVNWNPFSKLLFLGGFGNLGGDIEVWDVQELKKIGQFKAHCTVSCDWSLDGSRILFGVLFPKLRVDNNLRVFDKTGQLCKYVDFSSTDLYQVSWSPYPFVQEKVSQKEVKDAEENKSNHHSTKLEELEERQIAQIQQPKKGMLTKRGNLSSMLNEQKITNHGGKALQPNEAFAREEDKEMEQVKNATQKKNKDQGIVFSRNKNKFVDQPKPPTEEEEIALERQKKLEKRQAKLAQQQQEQQQKAQQRLKEQEKLLDQVKEDTQEDDAIKRFLLSQGITDTDMLQDKRINDLKGQSNNSNSGSRKQSSGGRNSPELDDFFDQTDDFNDQDKMHVQAIAKKE